MKPVSDLLREVTADAPPPRLDVDDVVAAGRRRRRRRNGGWAIAAAAATAVAIGVPQIARPPAVPSDPVVAASATARATTPGKLPFEYTFRGYSSGRFRVGDPTMLALDRQQAAIRAIGSNGVSGSLVVYRPGVEVPGMKVARLTDTEPVNGRPAVIIHTPPGEVRVEYQMAWRYADDAWAVVWLMEHGGRTSAAELRAIVEAFPPSAPREVTLGFKLGHVADGYRLAEVGTDEPGRASSALFLPEKETTERLRRPDRGPGEFVARSIQVKAWQDNGDYPAGPTEPTCRADRHTCTLWLPGGRTRLQVFYEGGLIGTSEVTDTSKLLKMLRSAVVADPGDPGTWYRVSDAIPASAQLAAR